MKMKLFFLLAGLLVLLGNALPVLAQGIVFIYQGHAI